MKCKICGKNDNNGKSFKFKEMMLGINETFDYLECTYCGCLQISKIPQDLSIYYNPDYYSHQEIKSSVVYKLKQIARKHRDKYVFNIGGIFCSIVNKFYPADDIYIMRKANVNLDARILDVGCGSGFLLKSLGDVGFKNLLGVDPFINDNIKYDNRVMIVKDYFRNIDGEFDLIMFNHSLEHMPDQKETISHVLNLLSKNGVCIIRIPTISSYAWKKYKGCWVQLDVPRHLFLHSIESIKLLGIKSGLVLKSYFYDSTDFQFWGSEQYLRGISLIANNSYDKNPKKSIFSKQIIKTFKDNAKKLNETEQGDQITLYFQKKEIYDK